MLPITIAHTDGKRIKFTFALDEIRVKIPKQIGYCKETVESMITAIYKKIEGYTKILRGNFPITEQALHAFTIDLKDDTSHRVRQYRIKVKFDDVEVIKLKGREEFIDGI